MGDNVQTSTGVACAIFPTSSSACIIFFIRAATGFFFGGMVPVFLKRDGQLDCWRRTEWSAQARVETDFITGQRSETGRVDFRREKCALTHQRQRRRAPTSTPCRRWSKSSGAWSIAPISMSSSVITEYVFKRDDDEGDTVRRSTALEKAEQTHHERN